MAEPQGEENSPLLGGLNCSPSHTATPPESPPTQQSANPKTPGMRHQGSMDSGCETDYCINDTENSAQPHTSRQTTTDKTPNNHVYPTLEEDESQAGPSGECDSRPTETTVGEEDSTESSRKTRGSQEPSAKVTFVIEGDEEEEDLDNIYTEIQPAPISQMKSCLGNRIPSFTLPSTLSTTSSTTSMPFCRICHHPEGEGVETLISPCRCAGTMKFIHHGCLMKWLEVSGIKSRQVPTCELCNYQFHRRKKFRIRQCQIPSCTTRDKILHCVFLLCLLIMFACAAVTVVCFKQNSNPRLNREDTELTNSEVLTLTCGVLFFVAFFVAMYVEVKATDTLYRLCSSFFYMNQTIHIYEYDKKRDDLQSNNAPV